MTTSRTFKRWAERAGLGLGVAVLLLWSLGPVYWSLVTSLTPPNALVSDNLHLWPEAPTLEHYAKLFGATSTSGRRRGGYDPWRACVL